MPIRVRHFKTPVAFENPQVSIIVGSFGVSWCLIVRVIFVFYGVEGVYRNLGVFLDV